MWRINAGKYRHIITFQRLAETTNEYGEDIAEWEDVMTTRAGIFPMSGKDYFSAQANVKTAEITHKIQLRYLKGIDSEMRIKFGNRLFDIVSPPVNFQEKNLELMLMCKERDVQPTGV